MAWAGGTNRYVWVGPGAPPQNIIQSYMRDDTPDGVSNVVPDAGTQQQFQALYASGAIQEQGAAPAEDRAVNLLQPDALNALTNMLDRAGAAAIQMSNQTGYVMVPVFDQDGRWSYDTYKDATGQPVKTVDNRVSEAQIAEIAANITLKQSTTTGWYQDPQSGQWERTPEAILTMAQASNLGASLDEERRQFDLKLNQQQSEFGVTSDQEQQKIDLERNSQLAQALADPTRFVEANQLANLYGTARGGQVPSPGVLPRAFASAGVGSLLDPNVAIAPELNVLLQNRRFQPEFGNPTGVQGSLQALSTVAPAGGSFDKVNPMAWRNTSAAGQAQYASLAQARQPGLKPADLDRQIKSQLPGQQAGVPAAFRV